MSFDPVSYLMGKQAGGGKSTPIESAFSGYGYGYIALNWGFSNGSANTFYMNLYPVKANKTYVFRLGDKVSDRLRAFVFYGKTPAEFMPYIENPGSGALIFEGNINVTGSSELSGDEMKRHFMVIPDQDGVLAIFTSSVNVGDVPTYLFDISDM